MTGMLKSQRYVESFVYPKLCDAKKEMRVLVSYQELRPDQGDAAGCGCLYTNGHVTTVTCIAISAAGLTKSYIFHFILTPRYRSSRTNFMWFRSSSTFGFCGAFYESNLSKADDHRVTSFGG